MELIFLAVFFSTVSVLGLLAAVQLMTSEVKDEIDRAMGPDNPDN